MQYDGRRPEPPYETGDDEIAVLHERIAQAMLIARARIIADPDRSAVLDDLLVALSGEESPR